MAIFVALCGWCVSNESKLGLILIADSPLFDLELKKPCLYIKKLDDGNMEKNMQYAC